MDYFYTSVIVNPHILEFTLVKLTSKAPSFKSLYVLMFLFVFLDFSANHILLSLETLC
jgi:hypothetical protein